MTFSEAYKEMKLGKKIRRHGWRHVYWFIDLETGIFKVHTSKYNRETKTAKEEDLKYGKLDLIANNVIFNDWEVVEEKEKTE